MNFIQLPDRTCLFILMCSVLVVQNGYSQNESIDSLRSALKKVKETEDRFDILKELAFQYRQNKPDSSLYFGLTAIELGNRLDLKGKLAATYNVIGIAHLYKGELSKALDNYQLAFETADVANDYSQMGHAYTNLGRLFLKMGDIDQSHRQFLLAKTSFEKANDEPGISYLYLGFSEWYEYNKNYDSAIAFSTRALEVRKHLPNKDMLISAMIEMGQLYQRKKDYAKAANYFSEAEGIAVKYNDPFLLAKIKIKTIELMLANDNLAQIDEHVHSASQYLSADQTDLRARLNLLRAKIAMRRNERDKAILFYKQVVDEAEVRDFEVRDEAASLLVEAFYTQGNFKEAEKYRLKARLEQGNKRNQSLLQEIEKINLRFELERRGKINQELELANTRKRIGLLTIGIVVSIGVVLGIALLLTRKRTQDKEQHKVQEGILLQKLTDSEKRNNKLLEESLLIICTHSLEGVLLSINSPGARTIGYEPDQLIGKNIESVMSKGKSEDFKKYIEEIKSTGTSSGFIKIKTSWGEDRFFLYRNVLVDEGERPVYVMGSALDVTEWKKTEQEEKRLRQKLADSERLYRLLSENSSDLVCLHALDGSYQFVSSSVNQLLGYSSEELIGINPSSLIHPDDRERLMLKPHLQTIEGYSLQNLSYRMKRKDGAYIWMEAYTRPIEENGKVNGFQTSLRDITIRKEYEQALSESKDKAEEATRYKSDFLSSMSHEIRTPLNAIIGLADILLKRNPREDQVKIFQMLKNSGDNLLSIVNDILDFSKVEAGKMELEETVFNLPETGKEIVQLFLSKAESKGIKLLFNADIDLPIMVKGDHVKIGQVISNLISNAIKFTSEGQVEVLFKLMNKQNTHYSILFSVQDSGIGIPADKLDMIFESFAQAGQDTARRYGGTGLGLAIVKKLVNLMGSEIFVESELGKGSKFFFMLQIDASYTQHS